MELQKVRDVQRGAGAQLRELSAAMLDATEQSQGRIGATAEAADRALLTAENRADEIANEVRALSHPGFQHEDHEHRAQVSWRIHVSSRSNWRSFSKEFIFNF